MPAGVDRIVLQRDTGFTILNGPSTGMSGKDAAFSGDGSRFFVLAERALHVLDGTTLASIATIDLPAPPKGAMVIEMGQSGALYPRETQTGPIAQGFGETQITSQSGFHFSKNGELRMREASRRSSSSESSRLFDVYHAREYPRIPYCEDALTSEWALSRFAGQSHLYYMGYGGALSKVGLRFGARSYPLGQFDAALNRPDIVLARLGRASKELITLFEKSYQRRLERLGLTKVGADSDLPSLRLTSAPSSAAKVELPLEAMSNVGLLRVTVEVNGVPASRIEVSGKNAKKTIPLELSSGANDIRIWATDVVGMRSLPIALLLVNPAPAKKPQLFVVAVGVGVSKYRDDRYSLRYAAKDAGDLVATFARDKAFYERVNVLTILDDAATTDRIDQARRAWFTFCEA